MCIYLYTERTYSKCKSLAPTRMRALPLPRARTVRDSRFTHILPYSHTHTQTDRQRHRHRHRQRQRQRQRHRHTHTCTRTYTHVHARICTCTHTHTHTRKLTRTHTNTYIHTCLYVNSDLELGHSTPANKLYYTKSQRVPKRCFRSENWNMLYHTSDCLKTRSFSIRYCHT